MPEPIEQTSRPAMRIGARLTLAGTLMALTICTVVCVTVYIGLRISLRREIDGFLEGEVQEFSTMLSEDESLPLAHVQDEIQRELGSRLRRDLTFRLLDSSGRLIVASDPHDHLPNPWPEAAMEKRHHHPRWYETIPGGQGQFATRVCSQWIQLTRGDAYMAQATYSLEGMGNSLATFRKVCLAAMTLAAGLSILGGRLIARKSLRPVRQMTLTAQQIGTQSLTERVARSGNGDELDLLAQVLNDMLARLLRQFQQVQQFTADAAHELRTPLAALRGSMEVALARKAPAEELRAVMAEGIEEYDRLARLADDLLLLARADAGRTFLHPEPTRLHEAVHDVVDLFTPLAQDKGVSLSCTEVAPLEMVVDGARLRQVLSNLLDNALKYTPSGGSVAVSLSRRNGEAILRVRDTGSGIPNKVLPLVFDRFYRVDAARQRSTGGTGLGLAICRTIVEAHGGRIELQSDLGSGTTAVVNLPLTGMHEA